MHRSQISTISLVVVEGALLVDEGALEVVDDGALVVVE